MSEFWGDRLLREMREERPDRCRALSGCDRPRVGGPDFGYLCAWHRAIAVDSVREHESKRARGEPMWT